MPTEFHPPSWYQHQDIVEPVETLRDRASYEDDLEDHHCAICGGRFTENQEVITFSTQRDIDVWIHAKCFEKEYEPEEDADLIFKFADLLGVDVDTLNNTADWR